MDLSNIYNGIGDVRTTKYKQDKNNLVACEDERLIKTFCEVSFDYVLSFIKDLNVQGFIGDQCYLAGGCIRNFIMGIPINDYDVFFRKKEYADIFRDLCKKDFATLDQKVFKEGVYCVADTENAITLRDHNGGAPIQFIIKDGRDPESMVLGTFDFENCMGWYDPLAKSLNINVMMQSLRSGQLVYNQLSQNPLNSIKRLLKFQKMGFEITEKCLFDMFQSSKALSTDDHFQKYKLGMPPNY